MTVSARGFLEDTDFWTKLSESTGGRPNPQKAM